MPVDAGHESNANEKNGLNVSQMFDTIQQALKAAGASGHMRCKRKHGLTQNTKRFPRKAACSGKFTIY